MRDPPPTPNVLDSPASRRQLLTMAAVGGAGLFAATWSPAAADAAPPGNGGEPFRITVLGTTDLHGNVYNWDYFKNAEYDDARAQRHRRRQGRHADQGGPRRARRRPLLTLDAGDTIQGTPLAYYYAKIEPITGGAMHPMAARDEPDRLRRRRARQPRVQLRPRHAARLRVRSCDFPLLGANAVDWDTGAPVFPPYVIKTRQAARRPADQGRHPRPHQPRRRDLGQGQRRGQGASSPASSSRPKVIVPRLKAAGCRRRRRLGPLRRRHLLVVRRRAALPRERRRAGRRAGARHRRDPRRPRPHRDPAALRHQHADRQAGAALRAATTGACGWPCMDLDLRAGRGRSWQVVHAARRPLLNSNTVPEDPQIARAGRAPRTRRSLDLRQQRHRHVDAGDVGGDVALRGHRGDRLHQLRPGRRGQGGPGRHADAALPVLSIAAPFNKAPRSRPATSRSATWPGSTSTTTRCSA